MLPPPSGDSVILRAQKEHRPVRRRPANVKHHDEPSRVAADGRSLVREFGATDIVTERGDEGVIRIKELTS